MAGFGELKLRFLGFYGLVLNLSRFTKEKGLIVCIIYISSLMKKSAVSVPPHASMPFPEY